MHTHAQEVVADGEDGRPDGVVVSPRAVDVAVTAPQDRSASTSIKRPPRPLPDVSTAPQQVSRQRASRRTTRQSIREFVREPRQALQRLRPQATRISVVAARKRASFRRKILRANTAHIASESHLKLGSFRSKEVAALVFFAKLVMLLGPIVQMIWTVWIEPDSPLPASQKVFEVGSNDAAEAAIQVLVVAASCLFLRCTLRHEKRQPVQLILAHLVSLMAIIGAVTFSADILKSYRPNASQGRQLLSFANTLLAGSIYLTLSYLTDHFAETILSTRREAFQHARQERLLQHSRRLSFALNASCGLYLAVRLGLTWRSTAVFDFIPAANIITPIRVQFIEHKDVEERHVLLDAAILTAFDTVLLGLAFAKCYFTHRLFGHIFISDFARRYTEFRVFVINFRNTVATMTLSGHVAAWAVPFYHTIDPAHLGQSRLPVVNVGSVQMQLGFRLSLALWLLSVVYCALPVDTRLIPAAWRARSKQKVATVRVKYFLSQAEALQKTAYRNLRHVGHADASEFILEHQIEAFNFAQLVYARGNANYDQELEALQALVGDPAFTVVEVFHDAPTDTHCLVLASETKIVVTFRGTSSKKNAKTDLQSAMTLHLVAKQLDLTKVPSLRPHQQHHPTATSADKARTVWHRLLCKRNDPKVHSGFYAAYLSVADRVLDRVQSLYESDARPILATGHSLGGALAVLCAFDLVARQKISNVACTTFGCPRVGNHAFQKRYAQVVPATFAFVHASDMVTKLPPKTPKAQSYASVGKIVLLNAFGNLIIEPNVLELDVMHRGYSPRAHTMRAYQFALLLWCLRSHSDAAYHPRFWRQSLAFLQAEYGHLPDVREYLKTSMLLNPHMRMSLSPPAFNGISEGVVQPASQEPATRAQLRLIAKRLETALREERENREDDAIALSLVAQLRQWLSLRLSDPREWFATDDALRVLVAQHALESDAAALNVAQLLTVQGLVKPERVVFTRHARFCFAFVDDDEEDEPEESADRASALASFSAAQPPTS